MGDMNIVREYRQAPAVVWKALTDPVLVSMWTSTGQGGRPEGLITEVGTKFRYVAKPFPGWDGIVRCEVLAVDEPELFRYSWRNKETDEPTVVTNRLQELPAGGTRLTWEHTGFRGIEGAVMSRLLGRVRRKMLDEGLPKVLDELDEHGNRRP
ncbi:MAG: SRPBCC domain-containing protein [Catenulispora sp.]